MIVRRLALVTGGFLLAAHGLVHLAIVPGTEAAEGGRLEWDGSSWLDGFLPESLVSWVGRVLVILAVVGFVVAGTTLVVRRWRWHWASALVWASLASLAAFAVTWEGLQPEASDFWRGVAISGLTLVVGVVGLWPTVFRMWGTTPVERQQRFTCDRVLDEPATTTMWRGIDVRAPAPVTYRWLCQMTVAPYSYDLLDNRGHRSPPALTPHADELSAGQAILSLFEVHSFLPDEEITMEAPGPPPTAMTYRVDAVTAGRSRIVVKVAANTRTWLGRVLLPAADWVMMRHQLRRLARLAHREAHRQDRRSSLPVGV